MFGFENFELLHSSYKACESLWFLWSLLKEYADVDILIILKSFINANFSKLFLYRKADEVNHKAYL